MSDLKDPSLLLAAERTLSFPPATVIAGAWWSMCYWPAWELR